MNTRTLLVSVLMLVSVLLSACASATATSPVPTAVPPTVAPAQALTTFSPKTFKLPMTFSYNSDWSIMEYPNQVYLKNNRRTDGWQLALNLVEGAKIADPNSAGEIPWPQDLVAYLRSNPHIEAEEPKPVTFGGFNGIQIDAYAEYTGDKRPFIRIAGPAEGWLYLDYEEMWRFIVLDDVNGQRLVITMTVNPAVNEFSMFADAAQKVLDTVVFSEPTTFSSKIFKLPMSVSFGSDWHVIDDFTDLVTVQATKADWNVAFNIVTDAKVADPVSGAQIPFPEDFASWIKSNPDFKADEPAEVTVAGMKGLQINAVPMTTKQKDFLYNSANKWNIIPSPEGWRFILLNDVNGERVLILLIAPAEQFKDAAQQAQSILDSLIFTK